MENYYKLLDVPREADIHLIKSAFRKKAKTCHPDLFRNNSEKEQKIQQKKFVKLSQAYETLSDKKKRMIYDSHLKDFLKNIQPTNEQKKQRSSSFSSEFNNFNKKNHFYKASNKPSFSEEEEDSLENLIHDIKKMMDQFEINYKDPLEILVEWAKNIFNELSDNRINEEKPQTRNSGDFIYTNKKSNNLYNGPFKNLEDELDHLKKIIKSKSKFSKTFENEIDQELLSIKKKYRI